MPDLGSLTDVVKTYSYLAIFFMMFLEGMCIPIPSELLLGFAGFMAYQGQLAFAGAILAGWLGSFAGSFAVYLLARKSGRKYLYQYGHLVYLSPERLDRIAGWFSRYGPVLILPWRQLPVVRTKISIAAGLLDMRYAVFTLYTALGILVWCTLAVSLGYYLGQNWEQLIDIFSETGYFIIAAVTALMLAVLYFLHRRRKKTSEAADPAPLVGKPKRDLK
ncbi:MAG TPA: DedA family protein [Selenomonadales bacterium]|nr:DedA family protein [Selenomonadales bacterium]